MKLTPFQIEQFYAQHEFTAPYMFGSSDCEAMSVADLLSLEPEASEAFQALWLGYTESQGDPELRQLVARLYPNLDPDGVVILTGAQEGIFLFTLTVLNAGDHMIVQTPAYQSQYQNALDLGMEVSAWKLRESDDNRWALDWEMLPKLLQPNTRALLITTPNNPTSYTLTHEELAQVVAFAREHDLYLFSDEVYRGLDHGGNAAPSAVELYEKAVGLGVMSKAYGLAGLRIGWLASQDHNLIERIRDHKFYTTICNSAPSEFLAKVALRHHEWILERNKGIIQANIAHLEPFFATHADRFAWTPPTSGAISFPRLRYGSASDFADSLITTCGVMMVPSTKFDWGDQHFRLGMGRRNLPEALHRVAEFLKA
ncbi:MAG: aminotransferase class I/II-fold pyridoxal phosphate-dependent enzyme [Phototrophicaceae bacterium]